MPSHISGKSNVLPNTGNIDPAGAGHLPAGTADGLASARDGQPRAGLSMQPAAGNTAPRAVLGTLPSEARANARVDASAVEALHGARAPATLPAPPAAVVSMPTDVEMEEVDDIVIPATSEQRLALIARMETELAASRNDNAARERHIEGQRLVLENMQAARRERERAQGQGRGQG